MSELPLLEPVSEEPRRRWPMPLTWFGLLTLGWILYEFAHSPGLGAMAICVKLGLDDFRTAFWLRRRDLSRIRGKTCFWLYLGSGAWKVCLVAFLTSITVVIVAENRRVGRQPIRDAVVQAFAATMLTVGIGMSVALLASLRAIWLGWRNHLPLWLHSAVHHAWRADVWPPHHHGGGRNNRLGWLLFPQLVLCLLFFSIFVIVAGTLARERGGRFLAVMFLLVGGPAIVLRFRDSLYKRLHAWAPADCWEKVIGDEREPDGLESLRD